MSLGIGLSDQTISNTASIVVIAFGATLLEKYFILDRKDKGSDSAFSVEPSELQALYQDTKKAFLSLGKVGYERKPAEEANIKFRRSIYFVKDMNKGDIITHEHIRRIRPRFGLEPKFFDCLIGKKVSRNIKRGESSSWYII